MSCSNTSDFQKKCNSDFKLTVFSCNYWDYCKDKRIEIFCVADKNNSVLSDIEVLGGKIHGIRKSINCQYQNEASKNIAKQKNEFPKDKQ